MDQNFTQKHLFLLNKLKYPQRLFEFDRQPVQMRNITYIAEATLVLWEYSKKFVLFVTSLQHYLILIRHQRFWENGALVDSANNIFSLYSKFCLNNYSLTTVKIEAIISNEKKFLLPFEIPSLL